MKFIEKQKIWLTKTIPIRHVANNLFCDHCGEIIRRKGVLVRQFSKHEKIGCRDAIVDSDHFSDAKGFLEMILYEANTMVEVFIMPVIPKGSSLFVYPHFSTSHSKKFSDTFDAADRQIANEEVDDQTVYANGKLGSNKQEGTLTYEERDLLLAQRDEELNSSPSSSEVDLILEDFQKLGEQAQLDHKKILADHEKKLLEEKKVEDQNLITDKLLLENQDKSDRGVAKK